MSNILVVGTSHIAAQSVREIAAAVEEFKPAVVAVELDVKRLQALLSGQRSKLSLRHAWSVGVKGYLFARLGQWVQQRLGQSVGIVPGADMVGAVRLARKHGLKVALIDQDIEVTLRKFSAGLTWRERFRFVGDVVRGLFFPKRELRKYGLESFDLSSVPSSEVVEKLIGELKGRYPSVYRVLVDDRNKVMIRNLKAIRRQQPEARILAVVGAGHRAALVRAFAE